MATSQVKDVYLVKMYHRHGWLWVVYRYRNGRRFKTRYAMQQWYW